MRALVLVCLCCGCNRPATDDGGLDGAAEAPVDALLDGARAPDLAVVVTPPDLAASPCGATCAPGQACIVPACSPGELCFELTDAGMTCPVGYHVENRGDCPPGTYECWNMCPAAPPFCVDLAPQCKGAPRCSCLPSDPCASVNGGRCSDASWSGDTQNCAFGF